VTFAGSSDDVLARAHDRHARLAESAEFAFGLFGGDKAMPDRVRAFVEGTRGRVRLMDTYGQPKPLSQPQWVNSITVILAKTSVLDDR
jgi:hypothetical protein